MVIGMVKSLTNLPPLDVICVYTKYFKSISLHKPFDDDITDGTMSEPSFQLNFVFGSHCLPHLALILLYTNYYRLTLG